MPGSTVSAELNRLFQELTTPDLGPRWDAALDIADALAADDGITALTPQMMGFLQTGFSHSDKGFQQTCINIAQCISEAGRSDLFTTEALQILANQLQNTTNSPLTRHLSAWTLANIAATADGYDKLPDTILQAFESGLQEENYILLPRVCGKAIQHIRQVALTHPARSTFSSSSPPKPFPS
jgi:hypothetical protein